MIHVKDLKKKIGHTEILKGVSFELPPKTVLGIIGSSGSGKTTLLRCLMGLERPSSGEITCNGILLNDSLSERVYHQRVKEIRRSIGLVFQDLSLFPDFTVLDNIIEAPMCVLKKPRNEAEEYARLLLRQVGLEYAIHRFPDSLSSGEQQRVAIVRALAMKPDILLLDDPTTALDPHRCADVRTLLRAFVARGHTMIIVSHALDFLKGLADYLLFMEEGEVIEFEKAENLLQTPQQIKTQAFLKQA
jgi:ABC-type polar amino acid transport system ATPase subunit